MQFDRVHSNAGLLACTRLGPGDKLLVLIHGWTCRRSHWAAQLSLLARHGEVLALDLPGHGDSLGSFPNPPSVTGLAHTLVSVIEAERKERQVILIGHSMGGAVALEAARLMGGVKAVVLVDTFVIPYGDLPEAAALEIEGAFRADFVGAMEDLVISNTRDDLSAAVRAQLHHDMASADPGWALPLWHDLLRWQPDAALAHSGGRLYAINGGMLPEAARVRCAPYLWERVIPEARHFPQLDSTAVFNRVLEDVLSNL